ncbi:hypothetical protein GCM10007898_35180 [Dyella flagellata]|uniref:Uncharacterized protein n=1 Tax=Dyella flagellata TaxID=1867833 RepID=A0ABQ5XE63_9GAMM|nr:hypothetical protein GCM10007898_35180 [Dyella flagellata]
MLRFPRQGVGRAGCFSAGRLRLEKHSAYYLSSLFNTVTSDVFIRDGDKIFRIYFINHRGDKAAGANLAG